MCLDSCLQLCNCHPKQDVNICIVLESSHVQPIFLLSLQATIFLILLQLINFACSWASHKGTPTVYLRFISLDIVVRKFTCIAAYMGPCSFLLLSRICSIGWIDHGLLIYSLFDARLGLFPVRALISWRILLWMFVFKWEWNHWVTGYIPFYPPTEM